MTEGLKAPERIEAYNHANGFDKLTLDSTPDGIVVRAHLWRTAESATSSASDSVMSAHNHRWDFCSRVMSGAIKVSVFVPVLGDGPYHHYEYRPADLDEMRLVGSAALNPTSEVTYGAGDFYYEPCDAVHVARQQGNDPLVTMIAHSTSRRGHADVYTRSTSPRLGERASRLRPEEVAARLSVLRSLLGDFAGNKSVVTR